MAIDRLKIILKMRSDNMSFAAIGSELGISAERVRKLVKNEAEKIKSDSGPFSGLSTRAKRLIIATCGEPVSENFLLELWDRGQFQEEFYKIPGAGKRTFDEISTWVTTRQEPKKE